MLFVELILVCPKTATAGARTQRSGSHGRIQSFPENAVLGCRSSSFPSASGCLLMTHSGKLQSPGILSSYSNTYVYISICLYRISSISKYILFNRVWTNIHIPYYIYTYSYRIYDVCIVNVIINIFCNIHRNVYDWIIYIYITYICS